MISQILTYITTFPYAGKNINSSLYWSKFEKSFKYLLKNRTCSEIFGLPGWPTRPTFMGWSQGINVFQTDQMTGTSVQSRKYHANQCRTRKKHVLILK
jgi:hypothetical protein